MTEGAEKQASNERSSSLRLDVDVALMPSQAAGYVWEQSDAWQAEFLTCLVRAAGRGGEIGMQLRSVAKAIAQAGKCKGNEWQDIHFHLRLLADSIADAWSEK